MNGSDNGSLQEYMGTQRVLYGFQLYYTPLLVCLGTVGNTLSVFVFFATKLRKSSSSYYLSALAISDTGFLIALFVSWLNLIDVNLFNMPGICQLTVYLTQVCSFLSVWFVVAFTVERFIAVRYPLKRPSMCTVTRAKMVLSVLTLFTLSMCSPYLFISAPQWRPDPDSNSTLLVCSLVDHWMDLATTLNYIDFVVTLLIPFCLIVVLNTLISKTVWRLARVRRSMTNSGKTDTPVGFSVGPGSVKRPILARSQSKQSSSSQTKVTEMLLVVSSVFICLNLPSYAIRVWIFVTEAIQTETVNEVVILQHYFNLLFNTNFGINFALYCVSGQNFRRALVTLFCPRFRKRQDNTQVTGTTITSNRRPLEPSELADRPLPKSDSCSTLSAVNCTIADVLASIRSRWVRVWSSRKPDDYNTKWTHLASDALELDNRLSVNVRAFSQSDDSL
ncbi:thyrotropin-releasing hormone receptor-like isoform X2 [Homalodisca vitripennis]|nr:thyrotropin-releasing hormone receptor-like isoform X2 [Homalodisca vitripennis]XP_046667662.1 thyrotropin-releasing hormone receptor-like isoform X2 [Homalodisca vitripennis]